MGDSNINWDYIVSRIEENLCVLVLGPEVFTDKEGNSLQKKLIEHLKITLDPQLNDYVSGNTRIKKYYDEDHFFLFEKPADRTMICYEIKSFYEQYEKEVPHDILTKIAKIPFHAILTVSPNLLLKNTFENLNFRYQFGYHKRKSEPQDFEAPEKNNPLIFNIFGSTSDHESMVLTHKDMFGYLESVFGRNTLPEKLKSVLVKAENLIFLGMPFDKWYIQLLLRLLDIQREYDDLIRFAANESLPEDVRTFYVEQFKMDFVNKDFSDFIGNIYEKCESKGILRKESIAMTLESSSAPNTLLEKVPDSRVEDSMFEQILDLISEGNLDQLFEALTDYFETKAEEFRMELSIMKGKYKRFMRWRRSGALSFEEFDREITKLTDGILELVKNTRKV
ncbi:MAG: SIR2 family protein [Bacteroidetes bacterium]|jgi:hypothetical protein|nr:SIR2 family protein [Bacteroidota bacterium]MDF1866155.1 SIR2 family protein [Saprospiraceae bacterium]